MIVGVFKVSLEFHSFLHLEREVELLSISLNRCEFPWRSVVKIEQPELLPISLQRGIEKEKQMTKKGKDPIVTSGSISC